MLDGSSEAWGRKKRKKTATLREFNCALFLWKEKTEKKRILFNEIFCLFIIASNSSAIPNEECQQLGELKVNI